MNASNNNLRLTPSNRTADARLEAALDRALAPAEVPGGVPAGLAQRIFERTRPMLVESTGVIARLSGIAWVRGMAASLAVTVSLGIVITVGSIFNDAHAVVVISGLGSELNHALTDTPTPRPIASVVPRFDASPASLWTEFEQTQDSLEQGLSQLDLLENTNSGRASQG